MIDAYLVDPIIVERPSGYDKWGKRLPPKIINVLGYVDWKTRLVKNIKGEDVMSSAIVYLKFDGCLDQEDFLIIDGKKRAIITVFRGKDFSVNHLEVFIA